MFVPKFMKIGLEVLEYLTNKQTIAFMDSGFTAYVIRAYVVYA